ncbi:MAG: cytochrome c [Thermomonas sp.]|uniref:cytochrome c n=1 Tax=Thermomonas sp. TaxID=1971895 RepID=UPI00260F3864|nr:cytochrome c [Thermomonas sp.]MCC7096732.1 cytochrome c [Thermomonas sp.]
MSNPDPGAKESTQPQSRGKRYLFLLILGFVLGMIATVMGMRALQARQDPFPDALMHVQGWHMDQLDAALKANKCSPDVALPHLQALRMTANNLEDAFPSSRDDERFRNAAAAMRAAADKAISAPPLSCPALGATMKSIGESCGGCHRDFRD